MIYKLNYLIFLNNRHYPTIRPWMFSHSLSIILCLFDPWKYYFWGYRTLWGDSHMDWWNILRTCEQNQLLSSVKCTSREEWGVTSVSCSSWLLPRVVSLHVGHGDLPKLEFISELQRSALLDSMNVLGVGSIVLYATGALSSPNPIFLVLNPQISRDFPI